jgi:hypothetical protein
MKAVVWFGCAGCRAAFTRELNKDDMSRKLSVPAVFNNQLRDY